MLISSPIATSTVFRSPPPWASNCRFHRHLIATSIGISSPPPERLANFFSAIYEFFVPTSNATNAFVPAELPARYAIEFVPAASDLPATDFEPAVSAPVPDLTVTDLPVTSVPVSVSGSSDYSVVSSANFVIPSVNVPLTCIESNPYVL